MCPACNKTGRTAYQCRSAPSRTTEGRRKSRVVLVGSREVYCTGSVACNDEASRHLLVLDRL